MVSSEAKLVEETLCFWKNRANLLYINLSSNLSNMLNSEIGL